MSNLKKYTDAAMVAPPTVLKAWLVALLTITHKHLPTEVFDVIMLDTSRTFEELKRQVNSRFTEEVGK